MSIDIYIASMRIGAHRHFTLGFTTVKLTSGKDDLSAFAACGDGAFKVDLKGAGLKSLEISDVYMTDVEPTNRYFNQEEVTSFSMVPDVDWSPLSGAFLILSDNACFVTAVSHDRKVVPRNIDVKGSPRLLVDSLRLKCIVSVSTCVRARSSSTRSMQDVVQFTSPRWNLTHDMDAGVRVFSITEWSYRRTPDAVPHVLIAVAAGRPGFSPNNEYSASRNGWIYLLRLAAERRDNEIVCTGVEVRYTKSFDAPVTAIATYGENDLVVTTWNTVRFLGYDPERSG